LRVAPFAAVLPVLVMHTKQTDSSGDDDLNGEICDAFSNHAGSRRDMFKLRPAL
jgi:hypothetical protein